MKAFCSSYFRPLGALTLCGVFGLGTVACSSVKEAIKPEVLNAHSPGAAPASIAIIEHPGVLFWLDGDLNPTLKKEQLGEDGERYVSLRLDPGKYYIRFVRIYPREGGIGTCQVEGGKTYSFKIIERQYLPKTGQIGLLGKCYFDPKREANRTGPAGDSTTPDTNTADSKKTDPNADPNAVKKEEEKK